MCPPEHFVVEYAINPWMDVTAPVDTELALKQWGGKRKEAPGEQALSVAQGLLEACLRDDPGHTQALWCLAATSVVGDGGSLLRPSHRREPAVATELPAKAA